MRINKPTLKFELGEYITAKKKQARTHENTQRNRAKADFFDNIRREVNQNKLTVQTLTRLLLDCSPEQLRNIFYRQREGSSSIDSHAAQLIQSLYKALGCPIDRGMLYLLIKGKLKATHSGMQKKKRALLKLPYLQWKYRPYVEETQHHISHELKGILDLNSLATEKLSLAEAILNSDKELKESLSKVFKTFPSYLPELIDQLLAKRSDNVERLVDCVGNSNFGRAIINANVKLALFAVQNKSENFFLLDQAMQQEIHKRLLSLGQAGSITEEIKRLHREANKNLEQYIFNRVTQKNNAQRLMNYEYAIKRINRYLNTNPNAYKTDFFERLKTEIEENGFSIDTLEKALADEPFPEKLFQKWGGRTNSNAAACLFNLYEVVSGSKLSERQKEAIVGINSNRAAFPALNRETHQNNLDEAVKIKIQKVIKKPSLSKKSYLHTAIYQGIETLNHYEALMMQSERQDSVKLEATRQQKIINAVVKHLENKDANNLRTDLQGNILMEITEENGNRVYCNIDLIPTQYNKNYKGFFVKDYKDYGVDLTKLNNALNVFLVSENRGSVIGLQEEIELHMRLTSRVIEKHCLKLNEINKEDWGLIRNIAAEAINKVVRSVFQQALCDAYDSKKNTINIIELNKNLDKSRPDLYKEAKSALANAMRERLGKNKFEKIFQKIKLTLNKRLFEITGATGQDYLRTNLHSQTVTRITATEQTAHNEQLGDDKQGLRLIYRSKYNTDCTVTPLSNPTIEARVPSIGPIKPDHNNAVKDVAEKLKYNYELLSKQSYYKGPMIYNVLMSFTHQKAEWFAFFTGYRKNKQRRRQARILKGSHIFNKKQISAGKLNQLCFVQAIPVNQHELKIDYNCNDSVRREALLMSEIALLSTLNHYAALLPEECRKLVKDQYDLMIKKYILFLDRNLELGDEYFSDSYEGESAIKSMQEFKNYGKHAIHGMTTNFNESLEQLVTKTLLMMMITVTSREHYIHHKKQFGTLTQTLSIFLEPMSIYGCKSANERFQMVSGRVGMLRSIANRDYEKLSQEEKQIFIILRRLVTGGLQSDFRKLRNNPFGELQLAIDKAYNAHYLEGAESSVSKEDQGAAGKVKASKNDSDQGKIKREEINTNVAEPSALSFSKNLNTSQGQAHKKNSKGQDHAEQFIIIASKLCDELDSAVTEDFGYR